MLPECMATEHDGDGLLFGPTLGPIALFPAMLESAQAKGQCFVLIRVTPIPSSGLLLLSTATGKDI